MKKLLSLNIALFWCVFIFAQKNDYTTKTNIHYYNDSINSSDDYINKNCVLDIYYPTNVKKFTTVIYFHGGGLTEGDKYIPEALKQKGICVIAPNYRLSPKVLAPKYIEDASAAVAWVFNNIEKFGGDSTLIFVSGHSAGGYLTSMIGLDKKWLNTYHIDANRIAGLIPLSGQAITHFTVRKERGIDSKQPLIDDLAPLYYVRPDASPMVLITGDRELELLGRYEENAYLMRMMKVVGSKNIRLYELQGYDHGMEEPAYPLLLKEINRIINEKK